MYKKFELFRLSLVPREQMDLIENSIPFDTKREEYLRIVFSRYYDIIYRKSDLHYKPHESSITPSKFLAGRIGRPFKDLEYTSPQDGLSESLHHGWKALSIILDPSEHPDGQKLAVEINRDVGKSFSIISSVIAEINKRIDAIYTINIHPISDINTFLEFAESNSGNITRISFDFSVPNMLGGQDSITNELRRYRDYEKAEQVSLTIKNTNGLHSNTSRVNEGIKYAEQGGGDISAKTKDGKTYSSKKTVKTTEIYFTDDDEGIISKLLAKAISILGQK